MAFWDRLSTLVFGGAIGAAARTAIEPQIEPARQRAWSRNKFKLLDPGTVAELRAQGLTDDATAVAEAALNGVNENRVGALVQMALQAVPVAEALELWRRGEFGDPLSDAAHAMVDHALAKAKVEKQYWTPIKHLFSARLDSPVIALAIVRGIMDDPGFLPVGPPSTEGKVKAFPKSPLNTLEEARASGVGFERLFVETAIAGRPMGPESAASAVFRSILERVDFDRAIAEGDVRNEWADAIFETSRQIASVSDYVNAHLRAWITEDEMYAGAARHGMSREDTHLLYLRSGRPAAPGQMATAAARGIDGPDGTPMDRAQFLKGIAESDIRPEWGPMLWESRFLYPPLFQLGRLVTAGAISAATAEEWAVKDRYPPEVTSALRAYWDSLGGTTTDSHVGKAQTQLWNRTHTSYIADELTDAEASTALFTVGVDVNVVPDVLTIWQAERDLIRAQLSAKDIVKAFSRTTFSRDQAITRLVALGYTLADANTLLDDA